MGVAKCTSWQITSSQHLANSRNNLLGSRHLALDKGEEQPWRYPVAAAGQCFLIHIFFQSSFQAGQPIRLSLGGQSSLDPVPVKRRSDIGPSAGACEHRWWFGLEVVLTWDYNERWYCYRRPRALPSEHFKLVSIEGLPISA